LLADLGELFDVVFEQEEPVLSGLKQLHELLL
jgi:hypothetical protein